ncbi:hypothetical protein BT96DRAFT_1017214 [Gymnopus androsaceus JB14]|uniref:Plus3 domain-containing protein n=1 Tax=Gymnopus androsaceus JB14 TaxID=1447944 RepID=A0A6A4HYQ6_9AGAR|nr:hypothetical protein BT96DRAFT_1017214 [Gymnopus androsaceus JB14]
MSDFDDELLELVDGSGKDKERKRKREGGKSKHASKRRKADVSDDDPESEEGGGPSASNSDPDPYPLQGKFIDEDDMQRLLDLPEIEREQIIAARMEERQKVLDKKALAALIKEQRSGIGGGDSDGPTGVAKAAKRQHTARGATKEKSSKLDELKAKRKAKDEKAKNRNSPKRDRSSSPMEMETDSESSEDEDGVITKDEEEEEKERKLILGSKHKSSKDGAESEQDETPATLEDLERVRLSRSAIAKYLLNAMKDALGREEAVYRICMISELTPDLVKPYKIDEKMFDRQAELVHGKAKKRFNLDKVSNAKFEQKEFERLKATFHSERVLSRSDIAAILAKSRSISLNTANGGAGAGAGAGAGTAHWVKLERSRLLQARTLAERRLDHKEVAELDAQIAEFDKMHGKSGGGGGGAGDLGGDDDSSLGKSRDGTKSSSGSDVLMKLSEKNRKANAEAVRKAEQMEVERRRRERKAQSGTSTPVPIDPSARLRTVPRTSINKTPTPVPSRSGTPSVALAPTPLKAGSKGPTGNGTPVKSFEAKVMADIEVDLGDF